MNPAHIFHDPTGKRQKLISLSAIVLSVCISLATAVFVGTILISPYVESPFSSSRETDTEDAPAEVLPRRKKELSAYLLGKARAELDREIAETAALAQGAPGSSERRIVAAFLNPWTLTGSHSLRTNAAKLTHLIPEWLRLNATGDGLDLSDWNAAENVDEVMRIAHEHAIEVHALIDNVVNEQFDRRRVHLLLSAPARQKKFARALKQWLLENGLAGVNLNFQNLGPGDSGKLPGLISTLRAEFGNAPLKISINLANTGAALPLRRLGARCDFVVIYASGERQTGDKAGPLASLSWFANFLQTALKEIAPSKVVIALSSYGIDWPDSGGTGVARSFVSTLLHAEQSATRAQHPEETVRLDPVSLNPFFTYRGEDEQWRTVWFLDGTTAFNQWLLASRAQAGGAAVVGMGTEDPTVWSFLSRAKGTFPSPTNLSEIRFPYQVGYEGRGELLEASSEPRIGMREISRDPINGLITSLAYRTFPSSVIITRSGFREKALALTFDDGPHKEYTPRILDILKSEKVKATFFVIGENANQHPSLIRRMWSEGHEIGNHTYTHPNLSTVGERRRLLEINTAQRVIQSITGRSTTLFRPPYNADIEASTPKEAEVIELANQLGYLTAGLNIDPKDWNLYKRDGAGARVRRTPQDVVNDALTQIERDQGNIVLLHDGGGDRSNSVEALAILIREARARGYTFTTLSELAGSTREKTMPKVTSDDLPLVGYQRLIFEILFGFNSLVELGFTIVLVLGISRLIFVTILALVARVRERYEEHDYSFSPPVSVIVAAYNEEKVINQTVQSLLASEYPDFEIVVVDDGSSDDTSAVVMERFGAHPKVTLIRQENGGKASALNRGIELARHDILVCLDADTQLAPDAIRFLSQHFTDPKVGAVAGNVKVGNRDNILTTWQSIEYISSQNLDRRAYAMLNAITVVPGAAGAWRRQAVQQAGGFMKDTLAEDMDLTWRIRRNGWLVTTESDAAGYTEAPDSVKALLKQRFRWSYGTLQCLWKHRGALCRYGWFGWLGLPTLWLFQFGAQVLAPIVDLQLIFALLSFITSLFSSSMFNADWQPLAHAWATLKSVGSLYALLFAIELGAAMIAFNLDRERIKPLRILFFQRFVYRQLMYAVVLKSLWMAITGLAQGWGKLQRTGTVDISAVVMKRSRPTTPTVEKKVEKEAERHTA